MVICWPDMCDLWGMQDLVLISGLTECNGYIFFKLKELTKHRDWWQMVTYQILLSPFVISLLICFFTCFLIGFAHPWLLKGMGEGKHGSSNRFVLQIVNRYWEGSKIFCLSYFDVLFWQYQIVHFSPMVCTSHQMLISIWHAQFEPHDKHCLRVKNFIAGLNLCVQFGCNCTYCCTFPSSVIRMTKFLELKFFSFLCPTLWLWTLAVDDSREFIVLCDHKILASDSFATTFLITLYLTKNSCPLQINFHEFAQSVIPNHLKKRTLPTYNTSPNDHFLS